MAFTLTSISTIPASADDGPVTDEKVINQVAPEVLRDIATSDQTDFSSDGLRVTAPETATETFVPLSSSGEVKISDTNTGAELGISLPFSEKSVTPERLPSGALSFNNENETSTIPVVKSDGSIQITTIIDGKEAPEEYAYEFTLPSTATFSTNDDGGLTITADNGEFLGGVAAPWARDSNGVALQTHYEVRGHTVVQVVPHRGSESVAYPVVADPWLGQRLLSSVWYNGNDSRYVVNAVATSWGRQYSLPAAHGAHVAELRDRLNALGKGYYLNYTIEQQFLCHVAGNFFESGIYNMESYRIGQAWGWQLNPVIRCNPREV